MNFHQLFGLKSRIQPALAQPRPEPEEGPPTIEDGSANALRRQLVQVLLRDVMRRNGIPAGWIDCQMLVVSSRSRGEGMYVRLVIKRWDVRVLAYALAFEKALMQDITRFEPRAAEWLYGISWQFEAGGSCPYPSLPDASVWQESPAGTAAHAHKQELDRQFAAWDAATPQRGAAPAAKPVRAYAPTQPQRLPIS